MEMISIKDDMPDSEILVSVCSERYDKYGYARLKFKRKYGKTICEWVYDEPQSIQFSPISHWWPIPDRSADTRSI
jgi:hypothetical protein